MERREFLKLCSVAGLGVAASQLPGTYLDANAAAPADTFYVFVNAGGGWDFTLFGDPKGNTPNGEGWFINTFTPGEIQTATGGNITFPPETFLDLNNNTVGTPGITAFFNTFAPNMTVIRGIDCQTNGHDTGQRNTWSGRLEDNTPCVAALIAAALAGAKPLAFITNGGYDSTYNTPVSKTRLGNTDDLFPLIYPNTIGDQDGDWELGPKFHTDETFARIMATRQARLDAMQKAQNLPKLKKAMSLLYTSRQGMDDLKGITDHLPDNIQDLGGTERQAAIVLAAYKAGLCQCATIADGGFDTHSNNDQGTTQSLTSLIQGVTYLFQRALELNINQNLMVVMGSDFGRTPQHNDAIGKDHHSVGGMVLIRQNSDFPGNRVIGSTDEYLSYNGVDAGDPTQPGDTTIRNAHIHDWLRDWAGIADNDVVRLFRLDNEEKINFG